jgi:CheY-like chemotaxis protein
MIEKKILCIDQSPESIELVRRILEHGGIQCKLLAAIETREGMKIALREIPDLILLDMHFPAGKMWDMIEQIHASDNLKGIPIIGFITMDYEGEMQKNISSRSQPDMFLQKPLDMDKLLDAIKQLLKLIDEN